jgi:hypothetical protein
LNYYLSLFSFNSKLSDSSSSSQAATEEPQSSRQPVGQTLYYYIALYIITIFVNMAASSITRQLSDLALNSITPLTHLPSILLSLNPSSFPKDCPVSVTELVYIRLQYFGFDNKEHNDGGLIVHNDVAEEILEIFKALYENQFPIRSIIPIHEYNNDDEKSMEANNTSAFNCRQVTGQPGIFSQHAYGRAIDINPLVNPYVKASKNIVLPNGAQQYVDRNTQTLGKINKDSLVYKLFSEKGWDWAGSWFDIQDYQHFEKRLNGEKRNPYGYGNTTNNNTTNNNK